MAKDNTLLWVLGGVALMMYYRPKAVTPVNPGDLAAGGARGDEPQVLSGNHNFAFENALYYNQSRKFDQLNR